MSALSRGLDLLLWSLGALAWGLAVFALASRFVGTAAGGLLGLAVATSAIVFVINSHLKENRYEALRGGACPHCGGVVEMEHRHRRWDPMTRSWASPVTSWLCRACGYEHAEGWQCPQCPAL